MNDPATVETWQTAFGKDFGGMLQGDNKTGQKGTNAMFVMSHNEIQHVLDTGHRSFSPLQTIFSSLESRCYLQRKQPWQLQLAAQTNTTSPRRHSKPRRPHTGEGIAGLSVTSINPPSQSTSTPSSRTSTSRKPGSRPSLWPLDLRQREATRQKKIPSTMTSTIRTLWNHRRRRPITSPHLPPRWALITSRTKRIAPPPRTTAKKNHHRREYISARHQYQPTQTKCLQHQPPAGDQSCSLH
jgi:hypothetical protein